MSTFDVLSPYDNSIIETLNYHSQKDVDTALEKAESFFNDRDNWLAPHQRISILEKVISLMQDKIPELTKIAAQEGGKPYIDSLVEVKRAINGIKIALQHISQIKGEEIPMGLNELELVITCKLVTYM